jgi:hypothetical protein
MDRLSGIDFLLFRINNLTKSIVLSKLLIISNLYDYKFLFPTDSGNDPNEILSVTKTGGGTSVT